MSEVGVIVKAIECCLRTGSEAGAGGCARCPYRERGQECLEALLRDALEQLYPGTYAKEDEA